MVGTTVSHYKILEHLGGGGMGVLYKARDLKLDRPVALKFLPLELTRDPEAKERFVHEARAASALQHNNICAVHDIDETEGGPAFAGAPAGGQLFIVMEYLEGETLKKMIAHGPLPVAQAVEVALQVTEGLSRAHESGIVHRDIKPANVMVTIRGDVKIVDFGLAKLSGQSMLTKAGSTVGTAPYMSPEQASGEKVDARTDIWSLGVVIYEMLTGERPFKGEYDNAVTYSILNSSPVPVAEIRKEVPLELGRIVTKCLEKKQSDRYQSAQDLAVDLRHALRSLEGVPGTGSTPAMQAPAPLQRLGRRPVIVAAGILALVALTVLLLSPWKNSSAESNSIAILPFTNMSDDRESEYFSDGITEDIIIQVSKIRALRVISRTSVMQYKQSKKNIRDIAHELDVKAILEGSVRRSGNQIRIVAQLINAQTDEHLWAETYDRELTQIFAIQSEVARTIARGLNATLSAAERRDIDRAPTSNVAAYEYYLRGRAYYQRYAKEDNEMAIQLYKKGLELDPQFASALAGLSNAYVMRFWRYGFAESWIDSGISAARASLALDSSLVEGYTALGLTFEARGETNKAIESYRTAVALNPNYAQAVGNLGYQLAMKGDLVEGLQWLMKATRLDPTNANRALNIGDIYAELVADSAAESWYKHALTLQADMLYAYGDLVTLYLAQKRNTEALAMAKKMLLLSPDDFYTLTASGMTYFYLNNYAEAAIYLTKAVDTNPIGGVNIVYLSYAYAKADNRKESERTMNRGVELFTDRWSRGDRWSGYAYGLAALSAFRGDTTEACRWLRTAIDHGWRDYRGASDDPMLSSVRGNSQYKQMIAKVRSTIDSLRSGAQFKIEGEKTEGTP
jgi:serine/threonine protein kinase/tetratricopeptide (TPR) repeat protein